MVEFLILRPSWEPWGCTGAGPTMTQARGYIEQGAKPNGLGAAGETDHQWE